MKRHRDSTDIPDARRNPVSIALPHDKPRADRAAELDALLERISTAAPQAGRRQAQYKIPTNARSKPELQPDGRLKLKLPDASGLKLELVPVPPPTPQVPTQPVYTAPAFATFEATRATTDKVDYIGKAIKELQEGRIDQRLWARSIVEAGGDESLARPSYLRARAAALRMQTREKAGRRASASTPAQVPSFDSASRHGQGSDNSRRQDDAEANIKAFLRSPLTILSMLILLVIAVTLVIALRPTDTTVEPIAVSRPPGALASGARSLPANNDVVTKAAGPDAEGNFMKTLQALEDAGSWNDVVLQATVWTQKEPDNAWAWSELSLGYANVQRLDDAHAAARKAVELAPKNTLLWRNLGKLSVDRDAPVEALLAFEEATRWNTKDAYSFIQAGILHARLDQLPEAKLSFDKALALNPADANARCGTAYVVQRQTDTVPPKPPNGGCRDLFDRASRPVDLASQTH